MGVNPSLELFFSAFIHKKLLEAGGGWAYEPGIGRGSVTETMFKGDERGFGQHSDLLFNSRLWCRLTVRFDKIGKLTKPAQSASTKSRAYKDKSGASLVDVANGLICQQEGFKIETWVGPSHQRSRAAKSVAGVPVGPPASVVTTEWGPWTVESKTAPNKSKPPAVKNKGGYCSTIDIECAAAYPFIAVAPDIDFGLTVTLSRSGESSVNVKVDGWHNRFPFYELLICKTSFHQFEPWFSGPNHINLGMLWKDFAAEAVCTSQNGGVKAQVPGKAARLSIER